MAHEDDNDTIPEPPPGRSMTARDAVFTILLCALVLLLLKGGSIGRHADQMEESAKREVLALVGEPGGWVADSFPLAGVADDVTAFVRGDDAGSAESAFATGGANIARGTKGVPPVSVDSFDPVALGEKVKKKELGTLLITGDSMTQPMDAEIAQKLADSGVDVQRKTHFGTAITKPDLLDWGEEASKQAKAKPDAVVVFLGAGEGFPVENAAGREVECCGPDYAAVYAGRVRQMMATYRQGGRARVYWVVIPDPRDKDDAEVIDMVNASLEVASIPWRRQVRLVDSRPIISPEGYRNSMQIDGRERIIRDNDGLHLTEPGAELVADAVLAAIDKDFER